LDRLVDVKYVSKTDGRLVPTEKGVALIRLVEKDPIASPELTGRWEHRLQRIEAGAKGESQEKFMSDIRDFTRWLS
jgi:DNA topoisomerase-3